MANGEEMMGVLGCFCALVLWSFVLLVSEWFGTDTVRYVGLLHCRLEQLDPLFPPHASGSRMTNGAAKHLLHFCSLTRGKKTRSSTHTHTPAGRLSKGGKGRGVAMSTGMGMGMDGTFKGGHGHYWISPYGKRQ